MGEDVGAWMLVKRLRSKRARGSRIYVDGSKDSHAFVLKLPRDTHVTCELDGCLIVRFDIGRIVACDESNIECGHSNMCQLVRPQDALPECVFRTIASFGRHRCAALEVPMCHTI